MKITSIVLSALAVSALVLGADLADAKDKGKSNKGGNKVKLDKGNKGVKVPPGQIKRYTRGAKLPGDLNLDYIDDLSKWKLKPLPKGQRYVKVGDEILSISDDTKTVIDAVGIVGDLLK
ncbi:hypothetical protein J7426_04465 [Tropicibacter sp. R16_0]|uniref:hypothetical protein n=1 Tax=Tropicibacter sp. R16_0 TaxID=2821102 RepID=UPI001ADBF24F|nr:hypothetical protein [Tropicibacter sp. R16_0]MBO9449497.1 hypothetical protein [Tropicibacter sp. R16_0]